VVFVGPVDVEEFEAGPAGGFVGLGDGPEVKGMFGSGIGVEGFEEGEYALVVRKALASIAVGGRTGSIKERYPVLRAKVQSFWE
jgi:hypothetical protein